jgi:hypothetical protein
MVQYGGQGVRMISRFRRALALALASFLLGAAGCVIDTDQLRTPADASLPDSESLDAALDVGLADADQSGPSDAVGDAVGDAPSCGDAFCWRCYTNVFQQQLCYTPGTCAGSSECPVGCFMEFRACHCPLGDTQCRAGEHCENDESSAMRCQANDAGS